MIAALAVEHHEEAPVLKVLDVQDIRIHNVTLHVPIQDCAVPPTGMALRFLLQRQRFHSLWITPKLNSLRNKEVQLEICAIREDAVFYNGWREAPDGVVVVLFPVQLR